MRIAMAAFLALVAGAPFAVTAERASQAGSWSFWGWVWAALIGALAFGGSLWVLSGRMDRARRVGHWIVMGTLTFLGIATSIWIIAWGFTPFSLEGMWIYPLALVPLGIVALSFASRRRSKREGFVWERPPGTTR